MHNINYEIALNETNRPIIKLPDDYVLEMEDKFFVIEMTRYFLQTILVKTIDKYDQDTINRIDNTVRLLGQVGDEIAKNVWDGMTSLGEADLIFNEKYHIIIETKKEFEEEVDFYFYNENVYFLQDGLRVLVEETNTTYELNNNKWEKI